MQMQPEPTMAAYYPNNVTTDHIQQYLDENKSLILKIVESQNSGKISECAENQARLQRNLMYLAAIADSQPQPPTVHSQQMTPPSMLYAAHPYPSLQQSAASGLMLHEGGGSSGNYFIRGDGTKQDVGTGRQTLYFTGNDGN